MTQKNTSHSAGRDIIGRDHLEAGQDVVYGNKTTEIHHHHHAETRPSPPGRGAFPEKHCRLDFKKLCYWLDRMDQEVDAARGLRKHLQQKTCRPFLFFMHGEEHDQAYKFLEFLQYKTLKKEYPELNTALKTIPCHGFHDRCGFHDQLEKGLAKLFMPSGTLEEIAEKIAVEPSLLYVPVTTQDWKDWKQADHTEMLDAFMEFWSDWPDTGANSALLIACLSFCYEPEKIGFLQKLFNKTSLNSVIEKNIKSMTEKLRDNPKASGVVLPKFPLIAPKHVETWINNYVMSYCDCDSDEISFRVKQMWLFGISCTD